MSDLLFATPWWLLGSLVAVGCVVFWSGNNRQQRGPKIAGIALVVLAIVLKLISFVVVTDKEKVTRHTNELLTAVQNRDWATFDKLLDDSVSLGFEGGTIFPNKKALIDGAKSDTDRYKPTSISAKVSGVEQDESGITVDIDASSEEPNSGYRVPSSWKLVWVRSDKDWKLQHVTCVGIMGQKSGQIPGLIK
jgi:hypothetical protein